MFGLQLQQSRITCAMVVQSLGIASLESSNNPDPRRTKERDNLRNTTAFPLFIRSEPFATVYRCPKSPAEQG